MFPLIKYCHFNGFIDNLLGPCIIYYIMIMLFWFIYTCFTRLSTKRCLQFSYFSSVSHVVDYFWPGLYFLYWGCMILHYWFTLSPSCIFYCCHRILSYWWIGSHRSHSNYICQFVPHDIILNYVLIITEVPTVYWHCIIALYIIIKISDGFPLGLDWYTWRLTKRYSLFYLVSCKMMYKFLVDYFMATAVLYRFVYNYT